MFRHCTCCCMPGAIMGGPAHDEVMKKIPGSQGRPGPHPWRGHEENTWQARPSRIRDPPGWPRPLPHPVSSPLFCCCSCLPCCGFLCCLLRVLLLLFHWIKTNLRPRGIGWRGRWEGGSGWVIHVTPWLIHVNVWQSPLQYSKVISLQLIKINKQIRKSTLKKKKNPN